MLIYFVRSVTYEIKPSDFVDSQCIKDNGQGAVELCEDIEFAAACASNSTSGKFVSTSLS